MKGCLADLYVLVGFRTLVTGFWIGNFIFFPIGFGS